MYHEIPKQPSLLVRERVALHNLTTGSYCLGQHLYNSLNMRSQDGGFYPYVLISLVHKGTLTSTEREMYTPTQSQKPLIYNINLSCLQNIVGKWWHHACRHSQPMSDFL